MTRVDLALTLLLCAGCRAVAAPEPLRIQSEGKPVGAEYVSLTTLHGDLDRTRPGDIVWVWGHSFVHEGDPSYVVEDDDDTGQLWRVRPDGSRDLLALEYKGTPSDLALTRTEWRSLRGVSFAKWDVEAKKRIQWIDPTRCLVEFGVFADPPDLSGIPTGVRYLDLAWSDLESLAGLSRCRDLRFLRLPREAAITSLGPVATLRELRYLETTGTKIADLSALGGHPQLRRLRAPCTPIQTLPTEVLPRLERFVADDSGCPSAETRRFRALQPQAYVATTSRRLLEDATRSATALRLRTGSTCHPSPKDKTLYTTSNKAEITALLELLRPTEAYSRPYVVPGCGSYTFEFLDRHGAEILEVGLLGESVLRASKIWVQPASLQGEVRKPLRAWVAAQDKRVMEWR